MSDEIFKSRLKHGGAQSDKFMVTLLKGCAKVTLHPQSYDIAPPTALEKCILIFLLFPINKFYLFS
jgi:hypothetical protein